jgi:hypothetical protein
METTSQLIHGLALIRYVAAAPLLLLEASNVPCDENGAFTNGNTVIESEFKLSCAIFVSTINAITVYQVILPVDEDPPEKKALSGRPQVYCYQRTMEMAWDYLSL